MGFIPALQSAFGRREPGFGLRGRVRPLSDELPFIKAAVSSRCSISRTNATKTRASADRRLPTSALHYSSRVNSSAASLNPPVTFNLIPFAPSARLVLARHQQRRKPET